jgi:hypothetical protein
MPNMLAQTVKMKAQKDPHTFDEIVAMRKNLIQKVRADKTLLISLILNK